jgi:hypothetical protein
MITTANAGLLRTTLGGSPNVGEVVSLHLEKPPHGEIKTVTYTVTASDRTVETVAAKLALAITTLGIQAEANGPTITLNGAEQVSDWTFISNVGPTPVSPKRKPVARKT